MVNLCIGQGRTRDTLNIVKNYGDDWKTIDIYAGYLPDEAYDVTEGIQEKSGSIARIWMGDVLEHIARAKVGKLLEECHRVLAPGGELLICVPDMAKVMPRWLEDPSDRECNWLIWGEQDESGAGKNESGDTHRCGFTERTLDAAIVSAGFEKREFINIHCVWYELSMRAEKGR